MAKGGRHLTVRKRVVAIFLVAVMLPGLILSYVGLKSIKQEKLSQQQLVLQSLKGSLALAVDRIETNIEDQIRVLLNSLPLRTTPITSSDLTALPEFSAKNNFVEQIFLVDDNFRLIYPRMFKVEDSYFHKQKPKFGSATSEHLQTGDSLESRGQFEDAIKEYQKWIVVQTSKQERMALLMRIARCEFKKNDLQNARQTYQKILAEDQHQFYGEEVPYVLIAYVQLVTIAEKLDSPASVANLRIDFYRMLLENFNQFERPQFEFYLEQVKTKLEGVSKKISRFDFNQFDKLKELETQVERESASGTLAQSIVIPKIQEELSLKRTSGNIQYLAAPVGETLWHIVFKKNNERSHPIRILGFKIRTPMVISSIQSIFDQVHLSEDIKLALLNDHGKILLPPELMGAKIFLSAPLAKLSELFPGYALGLVATGENPVEAISGKSLAIYYVLMFSIVAMILLGIVFIFRDISREQQLSQMKSEFIANVSHEIKTPIATIRTLAENLNEGWVKNQNKQLEYFHLMARESERLSHLVENILDFSRIDAERKTYHKQLVPMFDLINKTVERFRLLTDGQGVKLQERISPDLPQVQVDPEAIEQAFLNLLDNAVKYSKDEKVVEISAEIERNYVILRISDRGRGIDKRDIEKIFEKFYRIESRDGKNVPGSGIGLTLVKEIVEAHAGTIEVQSEINKGSTFSVFIPINRM